MIAVDTNVLIYAHRSEFELHHEAHEYLAGLCEGMTPWALPVPCVSEFLRVTTHPRVLSPPSEIKEALAFIAAQVSSPSCRLLRPGPGYLDHLFQAVVSASARGNLVFDAQIVALCKEHGVTRVLTNDRDFERFDGMSVEVLASVHEPPATYHATLTVKDFLKVSDTP